MTMRKIIGYFDGMDSALLTDLVCEGYDTLPISNGFDNHGMNVRIINNENRVDILVTYLHKIYSPEGETPSADGVTYSPEAPTPSPEGETPSPEGTDVSPTETPISSMYLFFAAVGQLHRNVHEATTSPKRQLLIAALLHSANNRIIVCSSPTHHHQIC